jgi:excisionase family DNA binding protein
VRVSDARAALDGRLGSPVEVAHVTAGLVALFAVPKDVAQLVIEVRELRAEMAALRAVIPPALVGVPEAAKRLGVSLSTMRRLVRDRRVPVVRVGHSVRVDLAAVRDTNDDEVARLALAARDARAVPRRQRLRAAGGITK